MSLVPRLSREVGPPRRSWSARVRRTLVRLVVATGVAVGGAQWGMAVEVRRGRVLEHQQEWRMAEACHPELAARRPAIAGHWPDP